MTLDAGGVARRSVSHEALLGITGSSEEYLSAERVNIESEHLLVHKYEVLV
ncbi:hypothetical protein [Marinagarivorans algicola]|uniref:hypothetical protein n=1 Tax=Marinagarivorans algicola TaxID=1513270 RepID=UPI0012E2A153|nr:hypothetical protein [Marinagarivorans algicola]